MSFCSLAVAVFIGSIALTSCSRSYGARNSASAQRIDVAVTSDGFVPAQTRVKVGEPVTLVITRQVARTCATDIVIKDYGVNKPLPQDKPVEVTFTPTKPGSIRYACAMGMIAGEFVAE